ncbi:hypothetical protein [Nocardia sp. NPDC051570]|uniref:hypothetical protein n=1 Tax=Nocardia sp. NPDC051570 TaxID=3364324 RepID=UPI003788CEFF
MSGDYNEYGRFFTEHMPPGWLGPALVVLGILLTIAVLVMLLISGAHFHDDPTTVPPTTPGTCQPFCTQTTSAPARPY